MASADLAQPVHDRMQAAIHDLKSLLDQRVTTAEVVREHHSHGESYHPAALPDRALRRRKCGGVQTIQTRVAVGVLGNELNARAGPCARLRPVVKPASWSRQHKKNDGHDEYVVGPAPAIVGPEKHADNASPEGSHLRSGRPSRSRPCRRACAARDRRKSPLRDCA